jgi:hypothetical protein
VSERLFLFIVGVYILTGLYFEIDVMIYALSVLLLLEGLTNVRITTLSQSLTRQPVAAGLTVFQTSQRINFDALRALRILVAVMLGGSFLLVKEYNIEVVWFFPWFMGFAIMGAGASGVCPMVLFIRWLGFK